MDVIKRAPKKVTIDYQKGKIYKIVNESNDKIFVGSTTTELRNRLHEDKKKLDKDVTGYTIILIENFLCKSKAELFAREYAVKMGLPQDLLLNPGVSRKTAGPKAPRAAETRFEIQDDEKNEQFRIRWREDGEDRKKKFSYIKKDKEAQREAAEAFRKELIASHQ